jgi:glycosyltransferase involved in cell wall biosynthesis
MKISGFSFVRNAILYDYPVRESITSLLPVCDEVIVAVGNSDDDTRMVVAEAGGMKTQIIDTVWDDTLRSGGKVLAQQTDIALEGCTGDWCIYLQADEVLHENDYQMIRDAIARANADSRIDALLFRYHHFYGSYDYVGTGRQWYRREVRAIRNTGNVISWGDAQGFRNRRADGTHELLRARQTEIRVYHYGWVRNPHLQQRRLAAVSRFWHDDQWIQEKIGDSEMFDYDSAHHLQRFDGTHPAVMERRIDEARTWTRNFDPSRLCPAPPLVRITDWIEFRTGWRIGEYKNFRET